MHEIAGRLGMTIGTLRNWAAESDARTARIRQARIDGAEWWEREARRILKDAFELARSNPLIASAVVSLAKEQAQAAWRCAAVRDPQRFEAKRAAEVGVNVGVNLNTGAPLPARKMSTAELHRIAQLALTDVQDAVVLSERSLTPASESMGTLSTPSPTPRAETPNWVPSELGPPPAR